MTQSIDRKARQKSRGTLGSIDHRSDVQPHALIISIRCFTAVSALTGAILTGLAIRAEPAHLTTTVAAATCILMAVVAGALLCLETMLADRQEFYRRGQLDGWMRGWRGQQPEVDDPLLRQ